MYPTYSQYWRGVFNTFGGGEKWVKAGWQKRPCLGALWISWRALPAILFARLGLGLQARLNGGAAFMWRERILVTVASAKRRNHLDGVS
jgi:hypothetical protein